MSRPGSSCWEAWNETDSFEIDLLAAFLLDDEQGPTGLTCDVDMDLSNKDSVLVSPESSEDGSLQDVGDDHMWCTSTVPTRVVSQLAHVPSQMRVALSPTLATLMPKVPSIGSHPQDLLIQLSQKTGTGKGAKRRLDTQQGGFSRKRSKTHLERYREKNRILARSSRQRKKSLLEGLKKDLNDLYSENQRLKALVRMDIGGEESVQMLADCDAESKLPEDVRKACKVYKTNNDQKDISITNILRSKRSAASLRLQDNVTMCLSDDLSKLMDDDIQEDFETDPVHADIC